MERYILLTRLFEGSLLCLVWFLQSLNFVILISGSLLLGTILVLQAFNVLRYEIGQRYASHYDVFSPAEYGPQKSQRVHSTRLTHFGLRYAAVKSFLFKSMIEYH